MYLKIDDKLGTRFPDLAVKIIRINDVKVKKENADLEEYKLEMAKIIKKRWNVEELRDLPLMRSYRDLFWKMNMDPTKIRPAAEALTRRILRDKPLYKINTFVDTYNLVSLDTSVPIASYDYDMLDGELLMREAKPGEEYYGVGMKKPLILKGGEAVIQDESKLIAIYLYRDAEASKITLNTQNVLMLICGAPGVDRGVLVEAGQVSVEVLRRFCGGNEIKADF